MSSSSSEMTARRRVEMVLRGQPVDRVPFTVYETKIQASAVERQLRNRGLCIVNRQVPVVRTHRPNVSVRQEVYWEGDRRFTRTYYRTPVGELTSLEEAAGFTTWFHERPFKSPDDYKALLFLIRDEQYEPCYESFAARQAEMGEDYILRPNLGLEPLQTLISGDFIAMQEFCVQWMDYRDEVLKLYEVLVEKRRAMYPLVAQSPALHANYGGNVVPEITGPKEFEQYYIQHYNEAAEVLHRHGKLVGCHYDGNCRLLAKSIARTDLDYIEAFTPAPDTDMTLAEARDAWPDKVLWINFPSSQHLRSDDEIEQLTLELLQQVGGGERFIMGVTEDVPPHRWQGSYTAICNGLDRYARHRG